MDKSSNSFKLIWKFHLNLWDWLEFILRAWKCFLWKLHLYLNCITAFGIYELCKILFESYDSGESLSRWMTWPYHSKQLCIKQRRPLFLLKHHLRLCQPVLPAHLPNHMLLPTPCSLNSSAEISSQVSLEYKRTIRASP